MHNSDAGLHASRTNDAFICHDVTTREGQPTLHRTRWNTQNVLCKFEANTEPKTSGRMCWYSGVYMHEGIGRQRHVPSRARVSCNKTGSNSCGCAVPKCSAQCRPSAAVCGRGIPAVPRVAGSDCYHAPTDQPTSPTRTRLRLLY